MNESYTQGEFCWTELGTRDIDAALDFYKRLMGWEPVSHDMGEMGTYYILQLRGQDVGAAYRMFGAQFDHVPPHWAGYIWVNDVDTTAAAAAGLGGQVLQPPLDIPGVGRMAFLRDPQGAAFAIFMGREHRGAARLDYAPGTFCWNELMTTDADSASHFYRTLLGWGCHEMPMGEGATYTVFTVEGRPASGMMEMSGDKFQGVPPHWMPYLSVADCDASFAAARSLGASEMVPPTDIPGTGRFAVLRDPSGAAVGMLAILPM